MTGAKLRIPSIPGGNQGIGNFLSGWSGDRNDGQADAELGDDLDGSVQVIDRNAFELFVDLGLIHVKGTGNFEPLMGEAAVSQQGSAEVSEADHGDRPALAGPQDVLDPGNQLAAAVADAGIAELAEVGQVLAHLGVRKLKQLAELRGAGGFVPVPHQALQLSQVQAQTIDDRFGDGAERRNQPACRWAASCRLVVEINVGKAL